jgi:hypothetical protein
VLRQERLLSEAEAEARVNDTANAETEVGVTPKINTALSLFRARTRHSEGLVWEP